MTINCLGLGLGLGTGLIKLTTDLHSNELGLKFIFTFASLVASKRALIYIFFP